MVRARYLLAIFFGSMSGEIFELQLSSRWHGPAGWIWVGAMLFVLALLMP